MRISNMVLILLKNKTIYPDFDISMYQAIAKTTIDLIDSLCLVGSAYQYVKQQFSRVLYTLTKK